MTDATAPATTTIPATAPAENTGFKGLLVTLFQRVVLSYKSTFIGIGVIILSTLAENFVNSPNKILGTIGTILGGVLILIKDQTKPAP